MGYHPGVDVDLEQEVRMAYGLYSSYQWLKIDITRAHAAGCHVSHAYGYGHIIWVYMVMFKGRGSGIDQIHVVAVREGASARTWD
jgi:hypothetical protein